MKRPANSYVGMPYFMVPEAFGAAERTSLSSVSATGRSLEESPERYAAMVVALDCMKEIVQPTVDGFQAKEGAALASRESRRKKGPGPASSLSVRRAMPPRSN